MEFEKLAHSLVRYLYTCPKCDELRDSSDVSTARCRTCGRCAICAPSRDVGLDDDCAECRAESEARNGQ